MTDLEETLRTVSFVIARFSGFCANGVLFGLVPILLLVVRPVFASLEGEEWSRSRRRVSLRLEGLVRAALWASLLATLVVLVLQTALIAELQQGDIGPDAFSAVVETSFGRWYLIRLPLLLALAVVIVGKVRTGALAGAGDGARSPARVWWVAWAALGLGLVATTTFSGHASVATPLPLSLANDLVHLGAGAIWFTGVVLFAVGLPDAWRGATPEMRLKVLAPTVTRFAQVAFAALMIVAATGTLNSFLHLGAPDDLIDTGYGRTLALKIVVFLAILGLGGINHFFVRAQLQRELAAGKGVTPRLFRRTIAAELALALGLMLLTGLLVGLARTKPVEVPGRPALDAAERR